MATTKYSMAQLNKFANETIKDDKKYLKLYSQTRCEIKYRVLKAYKNFFRRAKERKEGKKVKVGFPRFKSRDRYKSIVYPQDNGSFRIEKDRKKDMLRVSKIGRMQIELHRKIEGRIKTMTIKKNADKYYAIFTAIDDIKIPEVKDTNPVGIDLGLNSFVALSDGTKIEKPKFMQNARKKIIKWQRKIAKRKKGSHRREKAKLHLQKEWQAVMNQSNDFAHKVSNALVNSGHTSFVVENLNVQGMVKNHNLAQSIYNASWNRFIQFLSYKAESAGMKVMKIDPRNTTQECSRCGNIKKGDERLTLEDRIYNCRICGLVMDRDENAAKVILKRATSGQGGSHAQGDIGQYIPTGNASCVEELRTDKTHPLQDAVIV